MCAVPRILFLVFVFYFIIIYSIANAQNQSISRKHIEDIALSGVTISPDNFSVCYRYGCTQITSTSIDKKSWLNITKVFDEPDYSPEYERALLAEYIGNIERIVGRNTQTQYDQGGTFILFLNASNSRSEQMDCIDESTNTLSYLKMLDNQGKIKKHKIVGFVTRGGLLSGYPHTAVLLVERQTKDKYVIDSWFYDNGRPAVVVPYEAWKIGWKPD